MSPDPRTPDEPRPRPIDDGRLAQTLVGYTGLQQGSFSIRGQASGRQYTFSSSERLQYVRDDDLERFDALVDFDVFPEHRIDPQAKAATELRQVVVQDVLREIDGVRRKRPSRRPPGRPRVSDDDNMWLNHLRNHCDPRWPYSDLVVKFGVDGADPAGTLRTRLARFLRKTPDLALRANCRSCQNDDYPIPPSRALL